MRILVIGSGGREHALAWGIAKSPKCETLFVMPGNGGTETFAENVAVDITDHAAVVAFAKTNALDFVVVGPDAPAVAGLGDDLRAAGLLCFSPSKAAAQLEGSKSFTKALCDEAGVPTAGYGHFDNEADALAYVRKHGAPIVIKADGLAAGKGVTVATTQPEAEDAVHDCFSGAFGASGSSVVIEEFLEGEEASVFALCDGTDVVLLPSAQDHKRVWDGDRGPNTGGMGAFAPSRLMTPEVERRVLDQIVRPVLDGMLREGHPYRGFLYVGLMLTADGPQVVEFNVRLGDPEAQVLLPGLDEELLPLLQAAAAGSLPDRPARFRSEPRVGVVLAAAGYPETPQSGQPIAGIDEAARVPGAVVFHAGTRRRDGTLVTSGGRVLTVVGQGSTYAAAIDTAYRAASRIRFDGMQYRRDIGEKALKP